ncbi:hypothetical protein Avbf_05036 [Armadillidium vulgare]|nr:hypothetical protein Avbf_05036 [Armadillidium vulgare]
MILLIFRDFTNESFRSLQVKSKGGKILQGLVYSQNGVYPWKLKFEEQRMILTLSTPDKVYLVAPQDLDKKDWLEVVLSLDGKNLALVVNDQRDSISLDKNITIDDKLTFTGFVGCLKAIVLDGNPQDLRSYIGTSVSRDVVGGCQKRKISTFSFKFQAFKTVSDRQNFNLLFWTFYTKGKFPLFHLNKTLIATAEECPTGSFCSVQSTFDCEKEIYQGNCHLVNVQYRDFTAEGLRYLISTSEECYQDVKISCGDMTTFYKQVSFSSAFLPEKSCEEYRLLGYKESGQFIIDSDGEGPLNPTETNVKNKAKYFLVNVQYREFTAEGLRYLISTSEECYQDVKISCGDLTTFYKHVSFSSAFLSGIDYLGDRHFGVCHCTGFEDCYQSTSQNSTNKNGYRIVNQTALPILQLKIQREESDNAPYSEPNLSLGKLYCKNNEIKNEPIAFLSSKSSLILSPWIEGELLLRFRTSSSKGNIFYQPSVNRNSPFIRASLQSGKKLAQYPIWNAKQKSERYFYYKLSYERGTMEHFMD